MKKDYHDQLILNSHGKVIGSEFVNCLKDIKSFLNKNKKEFIILKIRSGKSEIDNFIKNILVEKLVELFSDIAINQSDRSIWFGINTVTMGQLRKYKKNVLILFDTEFFDNFTLTKNSTIQAAITEVEEIMKTNGIFLRTKFAKEHNYYKSNSMQLIQKMEESLLEVEKNRLRVSYYILSPQKTFRFNYLLSLPTVYKLEKEQFLKKNVVMSHLIECIHNSEDINISIIIIKSIDE